MFACMEALLKIYALLAAVSRTQLFTSWVGNGLLAYVKVSNSHSSKIHPPLNIHHHHHVPEGLGMLSSSLILKMKLVPPLLSY